MRKILELFYLKDHLPMAKDVLQRVWRVPEVNEKVRALSRLQSDLQAICPELLHLPGSVDNLWFLRFPASCDDLEQLA